MSTEEASVNTDGTSSFDETTGSPPVNTPGGEEFEDAIPPTIDGEEILKAAAPQVDPAVYFLIVVIILAALYYFFVYRKKSSASEDDFFAELDGDKFKLKLPSEVDEYYIIKEKCEAAGWKPGQGNGAIANTSGPGRVLAQALMKRAVADIPIVTHIQKEAPGMNKLYSQSMCSVNQWRSYQAAESMVSSEVEEVRAEADEIEPGWSQMIWRQAMQYHQVLKQKHEQELKAAEEQAKKKKEAEQKGQAAAPVTEQPAAANVAAPAPPAAAALSAEEEAERIRLAEKAAEELIKMEERELESKKAFSSKGMKKGFLDSGGKGKKKK